MHAHLVRAQVEMAHQIMCTALVQLKACARSEAASEPVVASLKRKSLVDQRYLPRRAAPGGGAGGAGAGVASVYDFVGGYRGVSIIRIESTADAELLRRFFYLLVVAAR